MKPHNEPTDRQERVFAYIRAYIQRHGTAPTVREITAAVSISSTSETQRDLKALERLGYIRRREDISRGIVLADTPDPASDLRAVIEEAAADIEELAEWAPALEPAEMQAAIRARAAGLRAALATAGMSL